MAESSLFYGSLMAVVQDGQILVDKGNAIFCLQDGTTIGVPVSAVEEITGRTLEEHLAEYQKTVSSDEPEEINVAVEILDAENGSGEVLETKPLIEDLMSDDDEEPEQERFEWNEARTKLLIQYRSEMSRQFVERKIPKVTLWSRIARRLNAAVGSEYVSVTAGDCDRKWRNLQTHYKSVETRKKIVGYGYGRRVSCLNWRYYGMMAAAVKGEEMMESPTSLVCWPMDSNTEVGSSESTNGVQEPGQESPADADVSLIDDDRGPKMHWSEHLSALLITTRLQFAKQFISGDVSRTLVWKRIAKKLNANLGPNDRPVTGLDCDRKWRNMYQQLKEVRDRIRRTGFVSIRWKHFMAMDQAVRSLATLDRAARQSVAGPAMIFGQPNAKNSAGAVPAVGGGASRRERPIAPAPTPTSASVSKSSAKGHAGAKSGLKSTVDADGAPAWFLKYVEQRDAAEAKRWEKLMKIEHDKIEAIKALTDVLNRDLAARTHP